MLNATGYTVQEQWGLPVMEYAHSEEIGILFIVINLSPMKIMRNKKEEGGMSENFIRCDTAKKIFRPKLVCQTSCYCVNCKYHPQFNISVPRHRGDFVVHLDGSGGDGKQGGKDKLPVQKLRGIKASRKTLRNIRLGNKK
jgi:hypothetical protein